MIAAEISDGNYSCAYANVSRQPIDIVLSKGCLKDKQ
jgi:hypothetical protein